MSNESFLKKRVAEGARLLTIAEVAYALHIGKRSVWRLIAAGELESVRIGRSVRVPIEKLETLIERGGTR
jgi:excisionase family DNA binding protein